MGAPHQPRPQKKSGVPVWVWLIAGVVALSLVYVFAFSGLTSNSGSAKAPGEVQRISTGAGTGEADFSVIGVKWLTGDGNDDRVVLSLEFTPVSGRPDTGVFFCERSDGTRGVGTFSQIVPGFPHSTPVAPGQVIRGNLEVVSPRGPCTLILHAKSSTRARVNIPAHDWGISPFEVTDPSTRVPVGKAHRVKTLIHEVEVTVHSLRWARDAQGELLLVEAEERCITGEHCTGNPQRYNVLTPTARANGSSATDRPELQEVGPGQSTRGWMQFRIPRGPGVLAYGSGSRLGNEPAFEFEVALPQ